MYLELSILKRTPARRARVTVRLRHEVFEPPLQTSLLERVLLPRPYAEQALTVAVLLDRAVTITAGSDAVASAMVDLMVRRARQVADDFALTIRTAQISQSA